MSREEIRRPKTAEKVEAVAATPSAFIQNGGEVATWTVGDWTAWLLEAYKLMNVAEYNHINSYNETVKRNMGVILEQMYEGMVTCNEVIAQYLPQTKKSSLKLPDYYIAQGDSIPDADLNMNHFSVCFPAKREVYVNIYDIAYIAGMRDFTNPQDHKNITATGESVTYYKAGVRGRFLLDGAEQMAATIFVSEYGVRAGNEYKKLSSCESLAAYDGAPIVMFALLTSVGVATHVLDKIYEARRAKRGNSDISDDTVQHLLERVKNGWNYLPWKWQRQLGQFRQSVEQAYEVSRTNRWGNAEQKAV